MAQEVLAGGPSEDAEYPETDSRVPGGGEWPAPLPVVISWRKRWLAREREGILHAPLDGLVPFGEASLFRSVCRMACGVCKVWTGLSCAAELMTEARI